MFVEIFKNNGIEYLRLVKSIQSTTSKGKKTSTKKVVLNIGPLKNFTDGKEDYIKRLKDSYKNGNPLIPVLNPYVEKKEEIKHYDCFLQEGDPDCIGHAKIFSHILIEKILEELGIISWINRYKALTTYEFDLVGFIRLLIYGRILNPVSKISTAKQNKDYYNDIVKDIYDYNIYDSLDFLYEYQSSLTNKINTNLIKKFNRTTEVIYYDVTNFFFEIERPDNDITDDFGNVIERGQRKFGVSKEHRPLPIVQMGLFMDEQGVPISIKMFPGNTLDHQTIKKSLHDTIDNLKLDRFIFVGDRGMYNGDNAYYLRQRNNGYIISKSILKTSAKEKAWIFDKNDYIEDNDGFKHKSRILKRKVKVNDNLNTRYANYTVVSENSIINSEINDEYIVEKVVVYFSKSYYEKQLAENKSFIEFLDKFKTSPTSFRISKLQSKNLKSFIKDDQVENYKTGEILNSKDLVNIIDYQKVDKWKEQFGYYQIVTSEIKKTDKEIIEIYHKLSRIEDQFRVMKSSLETRPLFVRKKEHIEAHLLVCMISLIVLRIIQNKIVDYKKKTNTIKKEKDSKRLWDMGISSDRLVRALNKWKISYLTNDLYRFYDIDDQDLKLILNAFNIEIPSKLFTKIELRQFKTNINIFK